MISGNRGTGGTGFGFWDSATPTGMSAFACFRFHSASLGKFDCFIHCTTGSFNNYRVPVVSTDNYTYAFDQPNYQLLISFAVHPSGSNTTLTNGPWNGGNDLLTASLGNPVWKLNSSGKGAFFPRQNDISGFTSSSRGCMYSALGFAGTMTAGLGRKLHIIASEDSLTIMHDGNNSGDCSVLHFGSYTPRSGTTVDSPYVCWMSGQDSNAPFTTAVQGSTTSLNPTTVQGAIAHPDLLSGSRTFILGGFTGWVDSTYGYNRFLNGGTYEKFPFLALISEAPTSYGILGTVNHVYNGTGMANYSVSSLSASCAWGNGTITTAKVITPWSGSSPTFTPTLLQSGINWSLDL
jgi:hypothetical protein